jgi:dihydrofolate reductase
LIDEYWLYVNPIVLGAGKSLFAPSALRTELELLETRPFENGVVLLRYRVAPTPVVADGGPLPDHT